MIQKIIKNKKRAVSPVIAVVLLIALTVAGAAIVWVVTQDILGSSKAELLVDNYDYQDIDSNKMVDYIRLTFRNIGTEDVNFTAYALTVNNIPYLSWVITDANVVSAGGSQTFTMATVSVAEQLTSDTNVLLTLTTDKDSIFQEILKIPAGFKTDQIGETGTVSVGATPVTVTFSVRYVDPVVIVTGVAANSSVVRGGTNAAQLPTITDVTATSFTVKQTSDSTDTDGITTTNVNYIVMETGVHYLRSIQIVVGKVTATGAATKAAYDFAAPFTATPVVLASPQTNNMETTNGGSHTRFGYVGGKNFTMQLEEGTNSAPGISFVETVGYIAIEAGIEAISQIQAYITADTMSDNWSPIGFSPVFLSPPITFAHMLLEDGGDAAYMSVTETTNNNFKISIEESNGRDGPHTNEKVSWLAIPAGAITGTSV